MSNSLFSKTRIAPTPSGFLHIGNAFSFALTASIARQTGANILLRIDDLDHQRVQKQYVQDIFDTLYFLGIAWHEGPKNYDEYENEFSQLKRLHLYEHALNQLRKDGHVFSCSCSRTTDREKCECRDKNLSLDEPGYAWRIYTPASLTLHEFIVKKKDGLPSYQLACVVDDQYYGIDLIIRGDDLRPSSEAQLYLAELLGYDSFLKSKIIHHKLLMENPEQKLSKSAGSTSLQHLRQQGKTPKQIFEMIGRAAGCTEPVHHWQQLAAAMK